MPPTAICWRASSTRDGHAVETVASGREALALSAERAFDLILLDVMMPEMSGYEVLSG